MLKEECIDMLHNIVDFTERQGARLTSIKLTDSEIFALTGLNWPQINARGNAAYFRGIRLCERH